MVRRRPSPPPSPVREERPRPVVRQPGVGLDEEEGQVLPPPPAPVRLEIIGIGEEEEIVELGELLHGGVDDGLGENSSDWYHHQWGEPK